MGEGLKTCAAVTMVHQDYDFLQRYVDHYRKHIGIENVYIFSHGNDPRHREIAKGANVMNLPRDHALMHFDRRRWFTLSMMASGLSQFYRWVITSDVDEFVILDPNAGDNLTTYLAATFPESAPAPESIAPFAIEPIHVPEYEPEPLNVSKPILSQRRIYRVNANYSKPCLTRGVVRFTPGGHANNKGPRTLSPDLYLLHLRFFDQETVRQRLGLRADQIQNMDWISQEQRDNHAWARSWSEYQAAARWELDGEKLPHPEIRDQMNKQRQRPGTSVFGWGHTSVPLLFTLPDRFKDLF